MATATADGTSTSASMINNLIPGNYLQGGSASDGDAGDRPSAADSTTATSPLSAAYQPGLNPDQASPYALAALPQVQQPISNPLPEQQQPSQQELGSAHPLGAAAYLGNQLLRGYMQGKAVNDLRKAAQMHQQSTGLQALYNDSAQQLHSLAASGISPQSEEFQSAQQKVQASWQSLMDFYGQHIEKPKGKNADGSGQNVLQRIQGAFQTRDPAQVSSAVYEGLKQTGPPVLHQIQPYLTPAYQAKIQQRAETAGTTAQTQQTQAQTGAMSAGLENERAQLLQQTSLTPEQQDRLDQLNLATGKPGSGIKQAIDKRALEINSNPLLTAEEKTQQLRALASKLPTTPPPKVGTFGDFMIAGYGQKPSPAQYVEGQKLWKQAQAATTTGTHMIQVPQPDGSIKLVQVGTSSQKSYGAPGAAAATTRADMPATTTGAGASVAASTPVAAAPAGHLASPDAHEAAATINAQAGTPGTVAAAAAPAVQRIHRDIAHAAAGPSSTVGGRTPTSELQSQHAMEDVMPVLSQTMKLLEPMKAEGGVWDSIKQRGSYSLYGHGVDTGPLNDAINQYAAFVKIAGASPWAKIGRGRWIMQQVQEHLPDPSKDSPGLMYQKLNTLNGLFQTELGTGKQRQQDLVAGKGMQQATGGQAAGGQPSNQPANAGFTVIDPNNVEHSFPTAAAAANFKHLAGIQ